MAETDEDRCRLCLVAPFALPADRFAPVLAEALTGGDVATLFVGGPLADASPESVTCRTIAQDAGVAVVALHDVEALGRPAVDGVQLDGAILGQVPTASRRDIILGADGVTSRHQAMTAAETDLDYLFFGRVDGDRQASIHPPALELAAWWAGVAVVPGIVMGGRDIASVDAAATAGIEFVALGTAVWDDERGAAAAVADTHQRLQSMRTAA